MCLTEHVLRNRKRAQRMQQKALLTNDTWNVYEQL